MTEVQAAGGPHSGNDASFDSSHGAFLTNPFTLAFPREVRKDGIGGLGTHHGAERLAARPPDARDAAERLEQRAPAPRTDAGDVVELRAQVAPAPALR